jgi:putative PIG3 family NAD(P)H quinone oxidoreductase
MVRIVAWMAYSGVSFMQAVVITQPGGPEVFELREMPTPEPQADQIRVRVHATALNRADLLQRTGRYPAPFGTPQDIPGLEFAGEIDAIGPQVEHLRPGQRVFGIVGGGAYAEYLVTHERMVVPIPPNLSYEDAAAVPEAFITAHDALFTQAQLNPGERVLVHAVGSGVGTAAVQLIKAVGATSYGTARTASKLATAQSLGLEVALHADTWATDLAEHTHDGGVHVVLDFVGGSYLHNNLQALAPRGRMVLLGTMAGNKAEIDLGTVMRKRLQIMGSVLRSRPLEEKIAATQAFKQQVVPLLAHGVVRPVVDRTFPLHEATDAHRYMEANSNIGKIVLRIQ